MPKDYKALLEEVNELHRFFAALSSKQQYEFHRQVHETLPLPPSPLHRMMVKIAQRIKQECEDERHRKQAVNAGRTVG